MSNRMKEEERIERIIRNLLKLPENRRCINCNSLGPQYVCTTFWTFVCTTCSGVHREFTHRVKSVSMAKFNAEEISALQAGGNERARQIYFKEWDLQHHSFPDGSNQNRLWDFIKHVYVDRKFTGYRCKGKLAMGAKEDFSDRYSFERPSTGGRIDDRNSKYYIPEIKSPRNKPDTIRSVSKNHPVYFEVVDDRFRDDGYLSGRRNETHLPSTAESKTRSRSPVSQKSRGKISPPVVRPVSELLGANVPRLHVGGSPNERKGTDSSGHGKKSASSSEPVESDPVELKTVKSVSLIDFSADPEPPNPAAALQALQTTLSIEDGNGASDLSSVNSVECILFGLSAPPAGPVDVMSEAPIYIDGESAEPLALSNIAGATVAESTTNKPTASPVGMELMLLSSSNDTNVGFADGQKLPITPQNQLYLSPSDDSISTNPITTPSVGALHNQSWTSSSVHNAQASSNASAEKSSQPRSEATQDGMKELPADLFTSSYSSFQEPAPGWQVRPLHGMGFHLQYYSTAMPVPAFPNSAKSRNPFDISNDDTEAQVPMFPSMLPVQAALPNLPARSALLHTSHPHSSHLMQPHASPYGSIAAPQFPYGMSSTPGTFHEQQSHSGLQLSRPPKINTRSEDAFASLNPIQQPSSIYPAPTTPRSFSSSGGNPFG